MDTIIDRQHACAFTGHRSERLGITEADVIAWLEKEIRKAAEDGYTQFITGMQRGVDLWAAEAVLKLKAEGKPLRLIAASAFRGMENQWESDWKKRYHRIRCSADEVHYISDKPGRTAFFQRNNWTRQGDGSFVLSCGPHQITAFQLFTPPFFRSNHPIPLLSARKTVVK